VKAAGQTSVLRVLLSGKVVLCAVIVIFAHFIVLKEELSLSQGLIAMQRGSYNIV
jgi:hypothetical protein